MKRKKTLVISLATVIIAAIVLYKFLKQVPVTKKEELSVHVLMKVGNAYLFKNKLKKEIEPGAKLLANDIIVTSKTGLVELSYKKSFRILIKPNSTLKIKDLIKKENIKYYFFYLNKGKIFVKIDQLNHHSWLLSTPTLSLGVRGTEFVVTTNKDFSELKVKEGKVASLPNLKLPENTKEKVGRIVKYNEKLKVTLNDLKIFKRMINAKREDLPRITKEKVVKDVDFKQMDQYFSIRTALSGGTLIVKEITGYKVYINNTYIGEGSLHCVLEPGEYKIKIENKTSIFKKIVKVKKGKNLIKPFFRKKKVSGAPEIEDPDGKPAETM